MKEIHKDVIHFEWEQRIDKHVPELHGLPMDKAMNKIADKLDEYKQLLDRLLGDEWERLPVTPKD